MIRINQAAEPADFEEKVRTKGRAFLSAKNCFHDSLPLDCAYPNQSCPEKIPCQWKAYWTDCLDDLRLSYNGICAYLGIFIEDGQVDHFLPKSIYYGLAYEWSNYRLAYEPINQRKGAKRDIFDPFDMPHQAFLLDYEGGSFKLIPNVLLEPSDFQKAQRTIEALGLNQSRYCSSRERRLTYYLKGSVDAEYMKQDSPYLWSEIQRLNLEPWR